MEIMKGTLVFTTLVALAASGCGGKDREKAAPSPTTTAAAASPAVPAATKVEPKKDAAAPAAAGGVDGIPECKAYFAKVLACPQKGPMTREKEVGIKRRELQEKLDKGRSTGPDLVKRTCETFDKIHKC
jgi:hypothetical protein